MKKLALLNVLLIAQTHINAADLTDLEQRKHNTMQNATLNSAIRMAEATLENKLAILADLEKQKIESMKDAIMKGRSSDFAEQTYDSIIAKEKERHNEFIQRWFPEGTPQKVIEVYLIK